MNAPRVLLLTRHYPPLITAGARRPFLLARGLRALGCEVAVCAPALPDGERGVRVPHPAHAGPSQGAAPTKWTPLRDLVRAHLSLPDPDLRWCLRAGRAAAAWARAEGFAPDWVLATSPPESVHVAGARLAHALGARLACDLRDNWLDDPLLAQRRSAPRRVAEGVIARRVLRAVSLLTAPTDAVLTEARRHAPSVRAVLVPQPGPARPGAAAPVAAPLTVLHTGSFSLSHGARGIEPFAALAARHAGDPRFAFVARGRLTPDEARRAEAASIDVRPPAPLPQVWAEQADAGVLVLVAAPGTRAVPGKLAEYRAAGRPVLSLGGGPWADALPGRGLTPDAFLTAALDPARRAALTPSPPPGPEDAARTLLDAMMAA